MATTSTDTQKLSFIEKAGYSAGDAAANFVFMSMVLFQGAFYAKDYGLSASSAAAMLLWPRLWDAAFDPIMGVLADRTRTRWGKFRPWVLWTSFPWAIVMVLAYTTPDKSWGWGAGMMIAYAGITNTLLMTLYSMNNMPYSALGGVMTGDLDERAKLNSYRFVSVNIAQFIVGGFTLPLVAKFAEGSSRQHGWQVTMTIWAVLCFVLFLVTFFTTKERIQPLPNQASAPTPVGKEANVSLAIAVMMAAVVGIVAIYRFDWVPNAYGQAALAAAMGALFLRNLWKVLPPSVRQDFADLVKNGPWIALFCYTIFHFGMLAYRGNAHYNYYHSYADPAAMFDFVEKLGLTNPAAAKSGGFLDWLGYIVHGTRDTAANSNAADVFNSILNMLGTGTTIVCIILSAGFSKRFGKKNVALVCFSLSALNAFAMYLLPPGATWGMAALAVTGSIVYAPTCAIMWAMYADAADYSEWQTGRRFTGMVFATIGFALKSGLAVGGAAFLWVMVWLWGYDTSFPNAPDAVAGYRTSSSIIVGVIFIACVVCVAFCKLTKNLTLKMADELAERRKKREAAAGVSMSA